VLVTPFDWLGVRPSPALLKYGAAALLLSAVAFAAGAAATHRNSPFNVWWRSYIRFLDRKLRELFLLVKPESIAVAQLFGLIIVATVIPSIGAKWAIGLALLVAFGPIIVLNRRRKKRLRALDAQIEPFLLAFTNALRTTSSIASALAAVEPLMANPMREELSLVMKELRVGSTIDQALLAMATRTHLDDLDAALSSVLIGRQVGGNLTEILETTAKTLREMARLLAVLKGKTNSGRVQFIVLAIAPVAIVFAFEFASPGYFNPLLKTFSGGVVLVIAASLWLVAIGMARKTLSATL
jgi:tight adherence protein B